MTSPGQILRNIRLAAVASVIASALYFSGSPWPWPNRSCWPGLDRLPTTCPVRTWLKDRVLWPREPNSPAAGAAPMA